MLQDVEAGKSLEIDGLLGAVIELAEMTGTETPALKSICACVGLLNRTCQPGANRHRRARRGSLNRWSRPSAAAGPGQTE